MSHKSFGTINTLWTYSIHCILLLLFRLFLRLIQFVFVWSTAPWQMWNVQREWVNWKASIAGGKNCNVLLLVLCFLFFCLFLNFILFWLSFFHLHWTNSNDMGMMIISHSIGTKRKSVRNNKIFGNWIKLFIVISVWQILKDCPNNSAKVLMFSIFRLRWKILIRIHSFRFLIALKSLFECKVNHSRK